MGSLSLLEYLHPLQLIQPMAALGLPSSIWMILIGCLVSLGAKRSQKSSVWLAIVGLLSMGFLAKMLPSLNSPWLFAALLGTFLLIWVILTPLFTRWSEILFPILMLFVSLVFLFDLALGVAWLGILASTSKNQLSNPWLNYAFAMWQMLALAGLLIYFGIKGWLTKPWFRQLSMAYLGTSLIICGVVTLNGQFVPYAYQDPIFYLTSLAAALWIGHLFAAQWPTSADLLERYKPYSMVAATHIFLILFTIATLYPVLWVVKMAVTPQQGFILGINPIPQPLLNYVNSWRKGDHKGARCYRRALAQNFREVMGQGSACYDQVCSTWRRQKNDTLLKKSEAICGPFAAIWKLSPPPDITNPKSKQTPAQTKASIKRWRKKKLKLWQQKTVGMLALKTNKERKETSKWLGEIAYQQQERVTHQSLFWRQVLNSVLVALVTTILGLFLACTAAYAFSRFRFPGRRMGLMSFLVSQMFPGTLMMIPLYILISKLGLLNSLVGLALVYSTTSIPFCVWMLKGYFDTIPKELEEAALIDGASRTLIFWKIMLPLARPAIAVTALFSFMTAWNEFILAITFMNDKTSFTLPVMLQQYVGSHNTEWGHFAAGAVLVSLPIILLFFVLQKNLVGGLTAGGVKG